RAQLVRALSGGQQQLVAIGRALMAAPRLLILDEPSLGLAPRIVESILGVLGEINRRGVSILLVEQNVQAALVLAHRGYILESGRIVGEGTGAALMDDPHVKRAYLGPLALRHRDDDRPPAARPRRADRRPLRPCRRRALADLRRDEGPQRRPR